MNADFFEAIEDIEKEKGIPRNYMYDKIRQAMLTAFRRDNPECEDNVESVLEGCMFPKIDRACMFNSLENRAPFIDSSILELALGMPDNLKQNGRNKKYILKETFKDLLPEATVRFRKQGFDVPVDHWLREDLREDLERLTSRAMMPATMARKDI